MALKVSLLPSDNIMSRKGKPGARRRRKATGFMETARLLKGEGYAPDVCFGRDRGRASGVVRGFSFGWCARLYRRLRLLRRESLDEGRPQPGAQLPRPNNVDV